MGLIFALIGRSASGKSTIEKVLEQKGYTRVVSNTTRPIRENEQNGIDYNYLTEDQFKELEQNNQLVENNTYRGWQYGIAKKDIQNLNKQNYICVIEPHGLIQMQNSLGSNKIIPIFIYSTGYERLSRSILRQPNTNEAAYKEICRRFLSDYDTFDIFEKNKLYEYKIHNVDISHSVNMVEKIIGYETELALSKLPDIPLGSIAKVITLKNKKDAGHLMKHIGHAYRVLSYIQPNLRKEKRYKLLINNATNETAYFLRSELQPIYNDSTNNIFKVEVSKGKSQDVLNHD